MEERGEEERTLVLDMQLSVPALRELYLDSVFFTLNAPLLLTLEVKNSMGRFGDPRPRGIGDLSLFNTLKTTPLLEHLTIDRVGLLAEADLPKVLLEQLEAIELPSLRTLSSNNVGSDLGLYSRIGTPPDVDVLMED